MLTLLVLETPVRDAVAQTTCTPDPAIVSCDFNEAAQADARELKALIQNQLAPFGGEAFSDRDVKLTFLGQARMQPYRDDVLESQQFDVRGAGVRQGSWRVLKPSTGNEFELAASGALRDAIDDRLQLGGGADPTRGSQGTTGGDSPDVPATSTGTEQKSWSGGDDSRVRLQPTTSWPWRTVADLGNCTATFVGPRHIVTAGHCLYNRTKAAWSSSFTVAPGRDAATFPYPTTKMPPAPGQTGWYFTPQGWRATDPAGGASQYDMGIVVVPDRLGDLVGWMGYGALGAAELKDGERHYLRGYPLCESQTDPDGDGKGERIDEPNPCVTNALYGAVACSVGSISVPDADGWNRRATHGCDASAGNSGSSLYTYLNGDPMVVMIHTTSTCGADPGDPLCTAADTHPLVATRITPEYRGWISYFRNLFP